MKTKFMAQITLAFFTVAMLTGCSPKLKQTTSLPTASNTSNNVSASSKEEDNKDTNTDNKNNKMDNEAANNSDTASKNPAVQTPVVQVPVTPTVLPSTSGLSTKKIEWSWAYSPKENASLLSKYHGYAFGDTSQKCIYLTFDEGYEYGYTASILDTLKANDIKATFFVTEPYVTGTFNGVKDAVLVKRMAEEGHIIGNHSVHHKSMPGITDEAAFDAELTGVEAAVSKIPGAKMSKNFRPPMGDFSELSLYYTQKLGYKSIFFAFAYKDYDVNNQPNPESSKALILKTVKPGMIVLLHAESKTNASILDSLIKEWKAEGYSFKTIDELS